MGTFPSAALVGLSYGFPVPFAGKLSGWEAIIPSQFAVFMYGVFLGGFVVVALAGAIAGFLAKELCRDHPELQEPAAIASSLLVSFASVMLLAALDLFIGPW